MYVLTGVPISEVVLRLCIAADTIRILSLLTQIIAMKASQDCAADAYNSFIIYHVTKQRWMIYVNLQFTISCFISQYALWNEFHMPLKTSYLKVFLSSTKEKIFDNFQRWNVSPIPNWLKPKDCSKKPYTFTFFFKLYTSGWIIL